MPLTSNEPPDVSIVPPLPPALPPRACRSPKARTERSPTTVMRPPLPLPSALASSVRFGPIETTPEFSLPAPGAVVPRISMLPPPPAPLASARPLASAVDCARMLRPVTPMLPPMPVVLAASSSVPSKAPAVRPTSPVPAAIRMLPPAACSPSVCWDDESRTPKGVTVASRGAKASAAPLPS
ncbi:hypothetical protein QFZ47_003061 [Variovorax paradoxus]|nr:hypothetical protein [Variovorax paradoxus]